MPAIEVKDVHKKFRVYLDKSFSLKERILFRGRSRYEDRWVLRGVNLSVEKGEAVGLVGHNGCGKSTLLKMMTRIMYPDKGSITMNGRVSSLIELGAGFHPDMSGRENIYTNASIFGLGHREIDQRIQDIIAFSELEQFMDNPVRTYSSGMYMRLAFSVAINVDADILLIDEILGVGDVNFQAKCFEKLQQIKANGTTIVIVSHALGQVEEICDRSYWIDEGVVRVEGTPDYTHKIYLGAMEAIRLGKTGEEAVAEAVAAANSPQEPPVPLTEEGSADEPVETVPAVPVPDAPPVWPQLPAFCHPSARRIGTHEIEFINLEIKNEWGIPADVYHTGKQLVVELTYISKQPGLQMNIGIGFRRDDGTYCYGTSSLIEYGKLVNAVELGMIRIVVHNDLLPGGYSLDVAAHSADGQIYDDIQHAMIFRMESGKHDIGVSRLRTSWWAHGTALD